MNSNPDTSDSLRQHIQSFFEGHAINERFWKVGPILKTLPQFKVFEIEPGPKNNLWTYVSSGAQQASPSEGLLEFMIIAPSKNARHVELLAMTAYYHADPQRRLGLGHTFPIGESWLPGSRCDHFLVSLPYPYGPELETWQTPDEPYCHGHILWLLPITRAEREYKVLQGLEALEQRFEQMGIEYWQVDRKSVV
jgi:hypothetical protein